MIKTTHCTECGSDSLVSLSSMNIKMCSCGAIMPWELKPGQLPLVANNRQKTKTGANNLDKIDSIVDDREAQHGPFKETARVIQNIKDAMRDSRNWEGLAPDEKEALEMVAHKMGRILTGKGNSYDSWADLSGYPSLIEERMRQAPSEPRITASEVNAKDECVRMGEHPPGVECGSCSA